MPRESNKVDVWYGVLEQKLSAFFFAQSNACRSRVIVAGFLPGRPSWPFYQRFLSSLELKDTSSGFCEVASKCLIENL